MSFDTGYEEWRREQTDKMNLTPSFGGCDCHTWEGVYHCVPCCTPDPFTWKELTDDD